MPAARYIIGNLCTRHAHGHRDLPLIMMQQVCNFLQTDIVVSSCHSTGPHVLFLDGLEDLQPFQISIVSELKTPYEDIPLVKRLGTETLYMGMTDTVEFNDQVAGLFLSSSFSDLVEINKDIASNRMVVFKLSFKEPGIHDMFQDLLDMTA